jgi:lipoprotein NlpD
MLVLMVLAGAGCVQPGRPPVIERSPVFSDASGHYLVSPGDSLYSIAWRFGLDYRALAAANGIAAPYTIRVGQQIGLDSTVPPARQRERQAPSAAPAPPVPRSAPAVSGWQAPTDAPVGRGYGTSNRGLDYALEPRHQVTAAAAGEVVYAGSGLGGFRHLVIVKHNPAYLSAYSLDRPVAVREGKRVKAGELLADTQERGRRNGTLHFEIRKNGAPVDPRSLIGR